MTDPAPTLSRPPNKKYSKFGKVMSAFALELRLSNVDGGTLKYFGAGGVTDTFTIPVYVQGGGTFLLSVAAGQSNGGKLIVINGSGYTFPSGQKESVYMTGPSSSVQLAYGATLECDDDYYQADGTLQTNDSSTCTLKDGDMGQGTAVIRGGTLWIANDANEHYGAFKVNGNLSFAGRLAVSIQGYDPDGTAGVSDVLNVSGTLTLSQLSSTLLVYAYGQLQKTQTATDFWTVIESPNNIVGNFASESSDPAANFNYGPPDN